MILLLVVACSVSCAGFPNYSPTQGLASKFPIAASLQIATNSLPVGIEQISYCATLRATGGVQPYSWSEVSGHLPSGLTLNPATGIIAGTPTRVGESYIVTKVKDSKASSVSTAFSLNVSDAPAPGNSAGSPVSITTPSNGATVSGSVTVAATAARNGVYSVQFYLAGLPLAQALTSSPYAIRWDTTQVADGSFNLSAVATDAAGNAAAQAEIAVTVKNTSWNPTVLGVPWAIDFTSVAANEIDVKKDPRLKVKATGDGVTDDTAAIRAAIQLASSSGGGVVYFPTGDYKIITPSDSIRGAPLLVPSRVILRGRSSATSRIFVNDQQGTSETDWTGTWGGIDFQGSSLSGMTDLGVYAGNSSIGPCALLWNRGSTKVSEVFFNNLDVHLNDCKSFWYESTDNLLVQGSHFDSNSSHDGPIYVVGNSHVSFMSNTITYHFGRVHLQNNTNLLMQGNTLIRDAENKDMDDGTAIESGGVELSFGHNIEMLNNMVETLNAPADESGDGEAIMTQQSTIEDVLDAGIATATTSTTLTDTNALWGSVTVSRVAQYPQVVAILTGSGTGEWRTIQAVNTSTKTLTLSQSWSTVPEVGSLYSIFAWTLMNANIQGNTLVDDPNGIVLFDGCYNCTVQDNTLTNSRGIILRTVDESLSQSLYPEGRRVHQLAINDKILNNTVSNTLGVRPAYIVLDTEAFEDNSYNGIGMVDIQVGGNTIKPYAANPNQIYNPKKNEIQQEGFFPCFLFGPAAVKDPVTSVFQNVHFWNNSQSVSVAYSAHFLPYTTRACVTAAAPPAGYAP